LAFSTANISHAQRVVLSFLVILWLCGAGALLSYFSSQKAASHAQYLHGLDNGVVSLKARVGSIAEQGVKNHLASVLSSSLDVVRTFSSDALAGILTENEAKKIAARILMERFGRQAAQYYVLNSKGNLQVHTDSALVGLNLMLEKDVQRQIKKKNGSFVSSKIRGDKGALPMVVSFVYYEPWDWLISAGYFLEDFAELPKTRELLKKILDEKPVVSGSCFVLPLIAHKAASALYPQQTAAELQQITPTILAQKNGLFRYDYPAGGEERVVRFETIEAQNVVVGVIGDYNRGQFKITDHLDVFIWPVLLCLLIASFITIRLGRTIGEPMNGLVQDLQRMSPESIGNGPGAAADEHSLLVEAFQNLQTQNEQTKNKLVEEIRLRQSLENKLRDDVSANKDAEVDLRREIESRRDALTRLKQEIGTRKSAEVYLQLFKNIFDNAVEGILITDQDAKILAVNRSFCRLTGYQASEVVGRNPSILQSGRHSREFFQEMWRELQEKGYWTGEIWNRKKNGVVIPELLAISAIMDERGKTTHYFAFMHDMTEMKKKEELISFMAYHDVLTKLPNRVSLETRLSKAISFARRNHSLLAVFFIDLDNFKNINDSLGHERGDQLLVSVAQRMALEIRDEDTLSRLGGDEFILLTENVDDEMAISVLANRILESFKQPFEIDGRPVYISASIGISVFPDDGSTIQELVKCADIAMYQAKGEGRNKYMMFTDEMNERLRMHVRLENAIRAGIRDREFAVHYQPKVTVANEQPASFEALIRWEGDGQHVGPDLFIPVAEKSNLINDLTLYMLEEVCLFLNQLKRKNLQVPISINISPRTFTDTDVVEMINSILARFEIDHQLIEFEITETTAMTEVQRTLEIMNEFRDRGYNFLIDDFGTGYSSLSYLNMMPLSTLKIDKRFITERESRGIASMIMAIAKEMHLKVVAEGVETDEQLEWLRRLGCDEIQGYYYSKPLPAGAAEQYLLQYRNSDS